MALVPLKIAVLMGGTSFEREFSLASGRAVVRALEAAGHTVLPLDTGSSLVETLREQQPDVAYIALHGKNGEDGTMQSLLEFLGIPYVGSPPHACRQAWNKSLLPHVITVQRINKAEQAAALGATSDEACAHWPARINLAAVTVKDMGAATALDLVEKRIPGGYPVAVKPTHGGSAMGITRVESVNEMAGALLDAYSFDSDAIIEKWITGTEIAVCVVGEGANARTLPPIEIVPDAGFFDTKHRVNSDLVDYYCPVRPESLAQTPELAQTALAAIEAAALETHRSHACRDLSRVDLIWDGEKPVLLELNVSPGMGKHSLFPTACEAAGIQLSDILEELIEAALTR